MAGGGRRPKGSQAPAQPNEPVTLQLIATKLERLVWRKRLWGVDERQVWHVVGRLDEMYRQLYHDQQVYYEALLAQAGVAAPPRQAPQAPTAAPARLQAPTPAPVYAQQSAVPQPAAQTSQLRQPSQPQVAPAARQQGSAPAQASQGAGSLDPRAQRPAQQQVAEATRQPAAQARKSQPQNPYVRSSARAGAHFKAGR